MFFPSLALILHYKYWRNIQNIGKCSHGNVEFPCSHRCTSLFKLMHTFQRGWIRVNVGTNQRGLCVVQIFHGSFWMKTKLHLFFITLRNLNVTEKRKGKQTTIFPPPRFNTCLLYCLFSFRIFVKNNKILVIIIFKPHPYFIPFFSCNLNRRQPLLLVFWSYWYLIFMSLPIYLSSWYIWLCFVCLKMLQKC